MVCFSFLGVDVVAWLAVGVPPRAHGSSPLSLGEWMVVIGGLYVSLWVSVKIVTWLDVKLSSLQLFRELRRELGSDRDRRSRGEGDR